MANINIQKRATLSSSISLQHEPLFLNPDGNRKRFPIGWNGYGRYVKGSLRVLNNNTGIQEEITEEDNGIFFSFKSVPSKGSYEDYTVFYNVREDDYKFSTGSEGTTYEGEEYFLFPNWLEAIGEKEAFWIGKYQASRTDANGLTSYGSSTILQSKKYQLPLTNTTIATFKTYASNKGDSFHIIRNREWSNIALWCLHHGIEVDGNNGGYNNNNRNDYLKQSSQDSHYESSYGKKLTGYGYNSYTHNNKSNGIWDLVGNAWEFIDGLKAVNGELYVYDSSNTNWIDTGKAFYNSLWNTTSYSATNQCKYITNLVSNNYNLLHECIPTISTTDSIDVNSNDTRKMKNGVWQNSSGERLLLRGGSCGNASLCGLFAFGVDNEFSLSDWYCGSRLAKEIE